MRILRGVSLVLLSVFAFGFLLAEPVKAQDSSTQVVDSLADSSSEVSAAKLTSFRKNLIAAAESSFKSKEISRLELFSIRLVSLSPAKLKEIHQVVAEQAVLEGKAASIQAIDWDKLLAFIKELIPIILDLIKFFM